MRYWLWGVLTVFLLLCQSVHASTLTLREKIGQMLIVGFEGKKLNPNAPVAKAIEEDNIGGVILFDYNQKTKTFDKNIESPEQVKALNHALQEKAQRAQKTKGRPPLPLIISVDYEGGQVNRLQETYGFPHTYSQQDVGQQSLATAHKVATQMAYTLKQAEFNLNFSPVLDVNTNIENPIIAQKERSFSTSPVKVSEYGWVYGRAFTQNGIQCAYKHFPGHGSSTGDSHLGFVDVSETWQSMELYPFQMLIHEPTRCGLVMTAHIVNKQLDDSGLPATLSHQILTQLLRKQMGFDGVIVTDDMQMKAISEHYSLDEALTLAINAGADMIIFGNQLTEKPQSSKEIIDIIERKVKLGQISPSRIEDAFQHIVKMKKTIDV